MATRTALCQPKRKPNGGWGLENGLPIVDKPFCFRSRTPAGVLVIFSLCSSGRLILIDRYSMWVEGTEWEMVCDPHRIER
jgi:hypothetical protein